MRVAWICAFVVWLQYPVLVRSQEVNWYVPPAAGPNSDYSDCPLWTIGSVHKLQWETTIQSYTIQLWQQNIIEGGGAKQMTNVYVANGDGQGNKTYEWTVQNAGADLGESPVFLFWLFPTDDSSGFTSHYFNMTLNIVSSSSSPSSSTTSPSTSSTTLPSSAHSTTPRTIAKTSSASSIHPPTHSVSSKSSTDNTALKVGLGTGLGLGIPLVLIIGIWVGMKVVRQRRPPDKANSGVAHPSDSQPHIESTRPHVPSYQSYELMGQAKVDDWFRLYEAPLNEAPADLGGPHSPWPG